MILDVIKWTDKNAEILRAKNVDVENSTNIKELISDMFEVMKLGWGIGLAAPQIGKNINLFVIEHDTFKQEFINPTIESFGKKVLMHESCLSVPNLQVSIIRKDKVRIKYYDDNWNYFEKEFEGIIARIIQHEYNHLIGRLIID